MAISKIRTKFWIPRIRRMTNGIRSLPPPTGVSSRIDWSIHRSWSRFCWTPILPMWNKITWKGVRCFIYLCRSERLPCQKRDSAETQPIPRPPWWWGGFFERLIGVMKSTLSKVIGKALESILTDEDYNAKVILKRSRFIQKCKDDIRKRWTREYLHSLEERRRGSARTNDATPTVGVIKKWKLGRIGSEVRGHDNVLRGCEVLLGKEIGQMCLHLTKSDFIVIVNNRTLFHRKQVALMLTSTEG